MVALILLAYFVSVASWMPTKVNAEMAINSLNCTLHEMDFHVNKEYLMNAFPSYWSGQGIGFFVDNALPVCANTALRLFAALSPPGDFYMVLDFTDCGINVTKMYGANHELEEYMIKVIGRFSGLMDNRNLSSVDPYSPKVKVPLYCFWKAEETVSTNENVGPTSTEQPPVYGNNTAAKQLGMNITSNQAVHEGDRITVSLILNYEDGDDYVAEHPMDCAISNADNPHDATIIVIETGCPNLGVNSEFPFLHFDAFEKNNRDFYFDFDAFTYDGQPSNLLIQCKVETCVYAEDCATDCWPSSSKSIHLSANSSLRQERQNSAPDETTTPMKQYLRVLPRLSTSSPPPSTTQLSPSPTTQLSPSSTTQLSPSSTTQLSPSSTKDSLAMQIHKTDLTVLYVVLGVLGFAAIAFCVILSIFFVLCQSSPRHKKRIPRNPPIGPYVRSIY